jgi:tRNA-specific 2-thiouridylase
MKNGADYVATGHYAVVEGGNIFKESNDKVKDQTYFLSQLTQNEISKILFPIGHLQKKEVRAIASKNNLPVATRKDSQGICFVGDLEMAEFLKRELKPESGKVLNIEGKEIGEHEGAILYTIGQRHGFAVYNISENQKNYYVAAKDLQNNTITVSNKKEMKEKGATEILISNFSFTNSLQDLQNAKNLTMRIRYRGEKNEIEFLDYDGKNKILKIKSNKNLEYAHGQFAVLYDGEKVLGGGEL